MYDFLRELEDNNSKDWMDKNRESYHEARQIWIDTCNRLLKELARHYDYFSGVKAADSIEQINNDLFHHSDWPTYKNHFGFSPDMEKNEGLYVQLSPAYSFVGGGIHNPSADHLKKIREAIDRRGDELRKILDDRSFQDYFGGLEKDEKQLKTSPRGYDQDHPHIELLRRKNFTVSRRISQEEVLSDDFPGLVTEAYGQMKPLLDFMHEAVG